MDRTAMIDRVALRRLMALDTYDLSDAELQKLADFFAGIVDSLADRDVAYGAYVTIGILGDYERVVSKLKKALLLSYRKRLVAWFEHALVKRANMGGGGRGIKKVENGLAEWVEAIPAALERGHAVQLSEHLPDTEYFVADRLDPVGNKILKVIRQDAVAAGRIRRGVKLARKLPFTVRWDPTKRLWFIPFDRKTYDYIGELVIHGFKANKGLRRWERKKKRLTPEFERVFLVEHPAPKVQPKPAPKPRTPTAPKPRTPPTAPDAPAAPATPLTTWFFSSWLPANIGRFTKVFSDYASNKQKSYKIKFSVAGNKVKVKFDRDINTAAEAVEELRYRYSNRHGREPWLEVMDEFVQLVGTTNPTKLLMTIDRINNLQHSNGLFMEHFPKNVQTWYEGFLNAKYNAPYPDELAKFIRDRDLRDLLIHLAGTFTNRRMPGFKYDPPLAYDKMVKKLHEFGKQVNWRAKGYPRYRGSLQIDRFDSKVQSGLDTLRKLDTERERILSISVVSPKDHKDWQTQVADWVALFAETKAQTEAALEAQRKRELERPGHAAEWERDNFPEEFLKNFPWAAEITKSEIAPFLTRYASPEAVADRWLARTAPAV